MKTPRWAVAAAVAVLGTVGCNLESIGAGGADAVELSEGDRLLAQGLAELSANRFEDAADTFDELAAHSGYTCESNYGLLLAQTLTSVDRISTLVKTVSTFTGAPGLRVAVDIGNTIRSFFRPFETDFARIRNYGNAVLAEEGCTLTVPDGLPIEVGNEDALAFARIKIGYEFDEPVARALVAAADSLQAAIDFILAHQFEVGVGDSIERPIDFVSQNLDQMNLASSDANAKTYISVVRAVGAFFDLNADLLAFETGGVGTDRIQHMAEVLEEALRLIYSSSGEGVGGILASMMRRASEDDDVGNNVLGWIDNGDGVPGTDDTLIIGLREANLGSTLLIPNNEGGVQIRFNSVFGDVDAIIASMHDIIDNLGDQLQSLHDPSVPRVRLTLEPINRIIRASSLLRDNVPSIPECVELDIAAYFDNPRSVRDLLPYWYDDGISGIEVGDHFQTLNVFMVEGEAATTLPTEPWVRDDDGPHFPSVFVFDTITGTDVTVDDASIAADGLAVARDLGTTQPLPYIAWQSPSFAGVLWVNTARFPTEPEGPDSFALANQYTVNKLVNDLAYYFIDEQDLGSIVPLSPR